MSEAELIVQKRKKKQEKYLFQEPTTEESEETHSTNDEGDSGVIARELRMELKEEFNELSDKARMQKALIEIEKRKLDENFFTIRKGLNELTKSELGNVARVVLSDRTITQAKGKQSQRQHKKILGALYHTDREETIEVEFKRAGAQEE